MTALERRFYRTREVKAAFAIGQTTLYEWIKRGWLAGVKVGRETRITAASFDKCAANLPKLKTPTMAKAALASGDQSALEGVSIEGRAGRDAYAKNCAARRAKAEQPEAPTRSKVITRQVKERRPVSARRSAALRPERKTPSPRDARPAGPG
jgi:excisionase family DNA binding protein